MDKCQNLERSCKSSKLSWILPNYVEVTHWLESKYAISTVLIRLFFPEGTRNVCHLYHSPAEHLVIKLASQFYSLALQVFYLKRLC